jgi:hypothetical protein
MWPAAVGSPSPQRIRWGAVFGGAVIGLALLALLTTLWFALAYGSGVDQILTNLEWYVGISAIVCLFLAGLMAGWLSGVQGAGSGFFNGVTIWALMLVATVTVGVPAIINVFNLGRIGTIDATTGGLLTQSDDTVLWATFAAILGGMVAAGLGGMIGGTLTRPATAHLLDQPTVIDDDLDDRNRAVVVDRPARPDVFEDDRRTVVVSDDDDTEARTYRAS